MWLAEKRDPPIQIKIHSEERLSRLLFRTLSVIGTKITVPLQMQDTTTGTLVVWDGSKAGQAVYVSCFSVDTAIMEKGSNKY